MGVATFTGIKGYEVESNPILHVLIVHNNYTVERVGYTICAQVLEEK